MNNEITIKEYLDQRSISYKEVNGELVAKCFFGDCDKDSTENEAHLYINPENGLHNCKKCDTKGNFKTIMKHFGDDFHLAPVKSTTKNKKSKVQKLDPVLVDQFHNAMPERIRKYLNNRGIKDEIIEQNKLGYGKFYGNNWITIPILNARREYTFLKLRKDPDNKKSGPKYKVFPSGSKAEIYGQEILKNKGSKLVICEGEFDCLVLSAWGIPAITSTAGASTFKEVWLSELKGFDNIYVALDKDEAGEKGADKLIRLLTKNLPDTKVYKITLPDRMTDGKDVSDYFNRYNGNPDELMYELVRLIPRDNKEHEKEPEESKNERFANLTPNTPISIETWKETIEVNFPDLLIAAEAGLSIFAQLLIKDITNPFALIYVDMPSSGKTIALNFFSTIKELVYTTDDFTPASLVSQAANRSTKDLEKNDLLPRLQYKTLIIRDTAPMFAKKDEEAQAMLGIMTRVLDGEGYENNGGVHGKRGYTGDYLFMLLAASTPIRPRIWSIMGSLGSRLCFLNINGAEKSEEDLALQLKTSCHDKEVICRKVTEEFIKTLWNKYSSGVTWNKENDDMHLTMIIARLAKILAKLRATINTWTSSFGEEKYNQVQKIKEGPDRLNQLLYNIARGHALIYGRENIIMDDLKLALKIAVDSAPPDRMKIFRGLIANNGHLTTSEVEEIIGLSKPIALKQMEEMRMLGIVEGNLEEMTNYYGGRMEHKIILRREHNWFLSEECKNLIQYSSRIVNKQI